MKNLGSIDRVRRRRVNESEFNILTGLVDLGERHSIWDRNRMDNCGGIGEREGVSLNKEVGCLDYRRSSLKSLTIPGTFNIVFTTMRQYPSIYQLSSSATILPFSHGSKGPKSWSPIGKSGAGAGLVNSREILSKNRFGIQNLELLWRSARLDCWIGTRISVSDRR
ncbi:hypothetical protein KQX54_003118 [Cotesia glomerata]|uniref:Uncharacterized protein n=1 Tax=Cotesia glomerata TaxID=32391 RepID=A0AAV7IFG0_COTGL|nr:hypothetical protein KQX54_003118 [Cotesia glomerata]